MYHKLHKAFSKFFRRHYDLALKFNTGLKCQSWFAVKYSSPFISVMNLDLNVRCFDYELRSFTRTKQLICAYEPQQNLR